MSSLILKSFRVTNFRNVHDSGWVDVLDLTSLIGPNESGKSNLCEALFRLKPYDNATSFDLNFDWPVDLWEKKDANAQAINAKFSLTEKQREEYVETARKPAPTEGERPAQPKFTSAESTIE